MGNRPRRPSPLRNYRIQVHLYQARGRLPPSCRAAPCRVRPSRRVHLLSRRARPSLRAPTPCQIYLPLQAQVVSILSGTLGRSGMVARRSVARRSVWVLPLDLLRHRHNITHLCSVTTISFSAPLHFLPLYVLLLLPSHLCMYRKLPALESLPVYRSELYLFNSIEYNGNGLESCMRPCDLSDRRLRVYRFLIVESSALSRLRYGTMSSR